MAKRITAKQRAARRRNMAIARQAKQTKARAGSAVKVIRKSRATKPEFKSSAWMKTFSHLKSLGSQQI